MKKGSIWRKWDLHVHSQSSYDYRNKPISNQGLINELSKNGISVVVITDHHFMDIDRIKDLQKIGASEEITVLPGIELCSDKGGSESIHFIGIFSENSDIASIWDKLKGNLNLTPADIKKKGNESIYCKLEESCDLIHLLGGIVTIHAGKKSNSIENITNSLPYKMALKADILKNIDIFEIGQPADVDEYKAKVYPNICKVKTPPMIICSDNHDMSNYILKANLWIKADPTFEGLKQIINEPFGRVYIGQIPEILERVKNNRTKYIQSIHINKIPDSTLSETWFENINIDLNHQLIAVIGNKGNGKSALVDIIGLLGNSKNTDGFSFLRPNRFKKQNKAKHFYGKLVWESGDEDSKNLNEDIDLSTHEKVKYIPQSFLEKLCNDNPEDFESELKKVIYTHVDESNRLGQMSLDDLINYKNEIIFKDIIVLLQNLFLKPHFSATIKVNHVG